MFQLPRSSLLQRGVQEGALEPAQGSLHGGEEASLLLSLLYRDFFSTSYTLLWHSIEMIAHALQPS